MEKLALKQNDKNLLKMNYASALKDEDFKTLVQNIELDSSIKMKYTSRLKEAALESRNCKNCTSLLECQNNQKGFYLIPIILDNGLTFSYKKCKYKEKIDETNKYLKNVYFYEIPTSVKSACFKNIYKDDAKRLEIIKKIKSFYDNYKKQEDI